MTKEMLTREMLKKDGDTYSLRHEDTWIPFARAYQNHFHMKNTYLEFLLTDYSPYMQSGAIVDDLLDNCPSSEEVSHKKPGSKTADESAVPCTKLGAAAVAEIARREKTSLQVMTSSENTDLTSFLCACGFQVKRCCYECRYTEADLVETDIKIAQHPSHLTTQAHAKIHSLAKTREYENMQDHTKTRDCMKKRSFSNIHAGGCTLERAHDGEKGYEDCARMLYHYYQETHQRISPLTVPFEIFSATLPETVYFVRVGKDAEWAENHAVHSHRSVHSDCSPHPNDAVRLDCSPCSNDTIQLEETSDSNCAIRSENVIHSEDFLGYSSPLFAAFVEENEIAYLCGRLHPSDLKPNSVRFDTQKFQGFLNALLSELFASYKEIFFEADDVDPLATALINRFRFRPKQSFDTYLFA